MELYKLMLCFVKGLFHKAILQSGTAVCPWAFQQKPRENALMLAKELGCTSQDPDEVLAFLKSVPAMDIATAQEKETLNTDEVCKISGQ